MKGCEPTYTVKMITSPHIVRYPHTETAEEAAEEFMDWWFKDKEKYPITVIVTREWVFQL